MFSLEQFYGILHNNLISNFQQNRSTYFYPFGTYQNKNTLTNSFHPNTYVNERLTKGAGVYCYFLDQEPMDSSTPVLNDSPYFDKDLVLNSPRRLIIIANSEKSDFKTNNLKNNGFYDWYYFYHGFAALDWYRDYKYVSPKLFDGFNKVFICQNNYISNFRSYRLHLVSNLISNDLVKHGSVSFFLKDKIGTWQDAIFDRYCPLSTPAKLHVFNTLKDIKQPLIIDTDTPHDAMSAVLNVDDLTSALFHVVNETVYFLPKLHLTEKTFKPIVTQKPFILVAAPGNLAYLKSYGFKTFDRWIDESYDLETDHYLRIEKITAELERLCNMSRSDLEAMYQEMKPTLEYNYQHFYGEFKTLIVNELVDNFESVLFQFNNGRMPNNHSRFHHRFDLSHEYLQEVKQRLSK